MPSQHMLVVEVSKQTTMQAVMTAAVSGLGAPIVSLSSNRNGSTAYMITLRVLYGHCRHDGGRKPCLPRSPMWMASRNICRYSIWRTAVVPCDCSWLASVICPFSRSRVHTTRHQLDLTLATSYQQNM